MVAQWIAPGVILSRMVHVDLGEGVPGIGFRNPEQDQVVTEEPMNEPSMIKGSMNAYCIHILVYIKDFSYPLADPHKYNLDLKIHSAMQAHLHN